MFTERQHVLRRALIRLLAAAVIAAALALPGPAARTVHAGAFPNLLDRNIGSVMNPLKLYNLYWDTSWDANNPGLSMMKIDDFTSAETTSGYFNKLSQYGVMSSSYLGSSQADPGCHTAPATVTLPDISSFVLCEKNKLNLEDGFHQTIVYMVYAPLSSQFNMNAKICLPSPPFPPNSCVNLGFPVSCAPGVAGFGGFHFQTAPSIIPLDVPQLFGITFTQCANTLNQATKVGSHEALEAATDPLPPFDWIDDTASSPFTNGEVADLCTAGVGSPAPVPSPDSTTLIGAQGSYTASLYWSNADGQCEPDIDLALHGVPSNISVAATSAAGAVVHYSLPTASDEDGPVPVVCSPPSGSTFAIGTTTVTCTATDADDQNSPVSASFTVTVFDSDLALVNVPAPISTDATSSSGATVTYQLPTVVDEDAAKPPVTCSPGPGTVFPVGTTTVNCTAFDGDDTPNTARASFNVTVYPMITATGGTNFTATEGGIFSGNLATISHPNPADTPADFSATINWGDGSPIQLLPLSRELVVGGVRSSPTGGSPVQMQVPLNPGFVVSGTHTYAEEGTYTITVTITDTDTPQNTATTTDSITVADAALTGTCVVPATASTAFAGATATFTDQSTTGTLNDFTAMISWGDGSSSAGVITGGPGTTPYTVNGTHAYAPGLYTISTTITDVGGSTLTVTCPTQTFVIPPSTAGCDIDGSGTVKATNGDQATFLVDFGSEPASANDQGQNNDEDEGNSDDGNGDDHEVPENVQTYRDLGLLTPFSFMSTANLAASCNGKRSGSIYGTGLVNGTTTVSFIIDVTSGNGNDEEDVNEEGGHHAGATYRIRLSNGFDSGVQKVKHGSISVHLESDEEDSHDSHDSGDREKSRGER